MPYATVTLDHPLAPRDRLRLVDGICTAMQAALAHPFAPCVRIVELPPERFAAPPDVTGPFALVEVSLLRGRKPETKRELYRRLVLALGEVGIAPADTRVLLYDMDSIDVAFGSGQAACDVELSYRVDR